VTVVAVEEGGKIVGQEVIHWANFAHIEDDSQSYTSFNRAIMDAAIRLGARSLYKFHCEGKPASRVAIAYGPRRDDFTLYHEWSY